MSRWIKWLLLSFIIFLSSWITYLYLSTNASPILVWSKWVTAIETGDAAEVARLTVWDNETIDKAQAMSIISTLQSHPEWKQKVFHELQKDAVRITERDPRMLKRPWFHITRGAGQISYRVSIPSFYFSVAGPDRPQMLKVNGKAFQVDDDIIGPFMATDTDIRLIYQNERIGNVEEKVQLDLSELWNEKVVQLIPTTTFSTYHVHSNLIGGDLFIDGHYAGEIEGMTQVAPLSYTEHTFWLERNLPWGKVQSNQVTAKSHDKEVYIAVDVRNEELTRQIGETLLQFNEGWSDATNSGDPSKFRMITPSLRKLMSEQLRDQQVVDHLSGHFVQVWVDPQSIEVQETLYHHFEVKVVAREDYTYGTLQDNGVVVEDYKTRRYWEYHLIYSPDSGWQVSDMVELTPKNVVNEEWALFHSERVLRFGIDAGLPPFEWIEDEKIVGFDIDIIKKIGEELDITVVIEEMPWNEILMQLDRDGGLDGAISAIDKKLAQQVDHVLMTEPYYNSTDMQKQYVIIIREGLKGILDRLNEAIYQLQNGDMLVYNELIQKYFGNE